jgi:hypothetical protein
MIVSFTPSIVQYLSRMRECGGAAEMVASISKGVD